MPDAPWIMMLYKAQIPSGSRRVALWRRIKALGAVYLQSGVCLLPNTRENLRRIRLIENEIVEAGGEVFLMESSGLDRVQSDRLADRFNQERDEAYHEFIERCQGFEDEIVRERAAGKFTYAELQENEEDLAKLKTWLEKIRRLDVLGASLAEEAAERLAACESLLDEFAEQVFEAQHENRGGSG